MTEIKVPVFPESVTDGTLAKWHKQPGESVARDDIIADIETDKVVFEVPSQSAGRLTEQLVEEGATVQSGQVIARMEEGEEETAKTAPEAAAAETAPVVMPAAEKLMKEHGLEASEITGSGKGGRILKQDVQQVIDARRESAPAQPLAEAKSGEQQRPQKRVAMTRLRARIAERLLEAQHNAAILTTFNEVDMQAVMQLRSEYREQFEKQHGVRLGFMSFFVKAAVEALKRFPEVNASIEGNEVVYHGFFDIGIAVGSPRGLVVPILRDADQLGMAQIESQINRLAEKAKQGTLALEEITGGTFSITNGGVFGSLMSTPILNPPQSGILGMHKIEKRPVVVDDEIVIRPMMYLAFSYDHRLIDGRVAVQFLVAIKEMIEEPARILLEV